MSRPKVSVLLPAYNAEKYIRSATLSVLKQTEKDLEVIAIDDGSTDGTLEILQDLQKKDKRLQIITRPNKGLVESLNEGIMASKGKWIARMDADDISLPERLATQISYAERNKLDVCGAYVRTFGMCLPRVRTYPVTSDSANVHLLFNTCFAHPTVLARSEVLKLNKYSINHELIEDYELWTRLAIKGYRLGNVPRVLLLYRKNLNQATSKFRDIQDCMRISISQNYATEKFHHIEPNFIKTILDRSGAADQFAIQDAANQLVEISKTSSEFLHSVRIYSPIFMLHNAENMNFPTLRALIPLCGHFAAFLAHILKIFKIGPRGRMWKFIFFFR